VEFPCWDDVGLEAGQVVTIEGGYVRGFRGVPQLNFDAQATLTPFEGDFPDTEELAQTAILTLGRLIEQGAANDATVRATLLEVRPGSGLVWRDPETNRVLPNGQTKGGVADLRIKMVLDDGTGAVSAVVGREATEKLLGKSLEECIQEAKDAMTADVIEQELAGKLVGRVFRCNGFARTDEYGLMFIARDMVEDHDDPETTAQEILARLEAL
jgi:replication factor A1